ncbi:MAG: helix-turn-helix transcriptional regulator [Gemmatimonadales bacterium]
MPTNIFVGEFEQLVLLSLLRLGDEGYALKLRAELSTIANRNISRGALYRTLDRLEEKGMVEWELEETDIPERGGKPRRRFAVSKTGIAALRESRDTLLRLWSGLAEVLG